MSHATATDRRYTCEFVAEDPIGDAYNLVAKIHGQDGKLTTVHLAQIVDNSCDGDADRRIRHLIHAVETAFCNGIAQGITMGLGAKSAICVIEGHEP